VKPQRKSVLFLATESTEDTEKNKLKVFRPIIERSTFIMDYNIKRMSDYSDESLLDELRRVAKKIGKDTLTQREYKKHARASANTIISRFGSWNTALRKAGLSVKMQRNISDEDLFAEIDKVWTQLGRQPEYREIGRLGKFSSYPYGRRFGSWLKAVEAFVQWKKTSEDGKFVNLKNISPAILHSSPQRSSRTKRVEYGEPIDFLGLRHAPLNEQGVIYLFGMLSKQLGFIIEAVRTDFPDCEGKRQISGKQGRWEQVSIEFEYKSSNFKEHGHNPDECDVIVCWENDWRDCPVEVISLKELMSKIKERKE
jgi:hypothetical protein